MSTESGLRILRFHARHYRTRTKIDTRQVCINLRVPIFLGLGINCAKATETRVIDEDVDLIQARKANSTAFRRSHHILPA